MGRGYDPFARLADAADAAATRRRFLPRRPAPHRAAYNPPMPQAPGAAAPSGSPRVAAVVLAYNGCEVTLQALASLRRMRYPSWELVVVDNGSTDGSAAAIGAAFPDVRVLRTEVNRGPAGGANLGIGWALDAGFDYVLVLNNDIEVDPEMLGEMVRLAESDPAIGCVGPKAYYHGDPQRIWSAGGTIRFREAVTWERGQRQLDAGQLDADAEVGYVNGCAVLVRRECFERVGLWDPLYHLAVEDADWCMRMRAAGWRCAYAHRARLWHMVSHTTGPYRAAKTFQTGRSTALFVRRHAGPLQWAKFLAFLAAAIPAAWVRELFRGNAHAAVAKVRGIVAGLRAELTPPPPYVPGAWAAVGFDATAAAVAATPPRVAGSDPAPAVAGRGR
jgi:GT2 family glycosyltransferase